jgi:hypothetical protein
VSVVREHRGTLIIFLIFFQGLCSLLERVKFIYSEKATKCLRNLHLFLTGTSISQKKVVISQNFCGLLRIHELYDYEKLNILLNRN